MVHPSRENVDYFIRWTHNGFDEADGYLSTQKHGWIRESFGNEDPDHGFGDGKWTVRFRLNDSQGKPIGKSSIRLKTVSGTAC